MDKTIRSPTSVSRTKPPILPKPKIIPEKPHPTVAKILRSSSKVVESPLKQVDRKNERNVPEEDETVGSIESSSISDDTARAIESKVNAIWKEPEDSLAHGQSNWEVKAESAIYLGVPIGNYEGGDEPEGFNDEPPELRVTDWPKESPCKNGEKYDSDGYSLTSLKSLDVNCTSSQDNTFINESLDVENGSEDQNVFPPKIVRMSKTEKAYMIAKEFVTSEQAYVQALRLIVNTFKAHIDSCSINPIISSTEFDKIVSSLPQLLQLNEALLEDLELRVNSWSNLPKLADVIVQKGPFLKLYSLYMKNFEAQGAALEELCLKYPKFSQALYDFENSEICKKLTLKHYMLKPVQRIPQYRLLLERYLSNIDEDSDEYLNATSALNIVKNVLDHANATVKSSDNLSKLLKLQTRLGNCEIIRPGRSFIKEGELQKLSRKEAQPRFFILLSDCLLYTTYSTSSSYLRMKYELPLAGMRVYSHDDSEFDIITSTRSFTLRARNEDECSDWMKSLQTAISENNQKQRSFLTVQSMTKSINSESLKLGKEAPVWIQDNKTTMCQICTAEFKVTFRRHHCRCCGRVVCGVCSNNRAPLQYLKFNSKRVCDECYDFLYKEFDDPVSNTMSCICLELGLDDIEAASTFHLLKATFKKFDSPKKPHKVVPQRLKEVTASDSGSQMSGWLEIKGRRCWKRLWFVLKDQVLYSYKASHDVVAYQTLPVLGYLVDQPQEAVESLDRNMLFRLSHEGQPPLLFLAPSIQSTKTWISALNFATVLQ